MPVWIPPVKWAVIIMISFTTALAKEYKQPFRREETGIELMRILDAIYESARTGKSVDIVR